MLKVKSGNLFENIREPCVIMHGCNAQGIMGAGFASTIRLRYPEAYASYLAVSKLKIGTVSFAHIDKLVIANCVTQEFYGRDEKCYVDYTAIANCLREVVLNANRWRLPIVMPFIGVGLGGGDPVKILGILAGVSAQTDATLWIQ